jgi:hypothetical protein
MALQAEGQLCSDTLLCNKILEGLVRILEYRNWLSTENERQVMAGKKCRNEEQEKIWENGSS